MTGFGSYRSNWLGAPDINMKMTFLALAGKCGFFGASGLSAIAGSAVLPSMAMRFESAIVPTPYPTSRKNFRLL